MEPKLSQFQRFELIVGKNAVSSLMSKKVAIFGLGGVGGYVAEALARSGIGSFVLIDSDNISFTNLNRQIIALHETVGLKKVDVLEKRILAINPDCHIEKIDKFILPENIDMIDFSSLDYCVDALDTVSTKISIVMKAKEHNIKVISSMGTGNKLNPLMLEVADISKTSVCPLARVMRYELRKRNINHLKVVYSKEKPLAIDDNLAVERKGSGYAPGSSAFVPSVCGIVIASEVVKDLIGEANENNSN